MTEIPDSIRLLFEASVEDDGDRYVVSIPKELVENGSLAADELYRIALMRPSSTRTTVDPHSMDQISDENQSNSVDPSTDQSRSSTLRGPPVEEGDVRSVAIDTLGDQGDGIAKVERGFIIIVPGTQPGDQLDVEITSVKETVAFAEPVSEPTVR